MMFSPLGADNFVENRLGGKNVQVNDREYSRSRGAASYYCANYQNKIECRSYIIVTGLVEEGTASAVGKCEHSKNCPTFSSQYNDWMQRSQ
jgi:hypothetical protein